MTKTIDGQPVFEFYSGALQAGLLAGRFSHEVWHLGADIVGSPSHRKVRQILGPDALEDVVDPVTERQCVMLHSDRTWTSYGDIFYFDAEEDAVAVRLMLS